MPGEARQINLFDGSEEAPIFVPEVDTTGGETDRVEIPIHAGQLSLAGVEVEDIEERIA